MTARRVLAVLALVVLLPLGWLLAAPQQVGGPVAVVTTFGTSMLPTYTASDLVVVARAPEYAIGDVVAYRSEKIGAVVLHRIVDEDDDGYITSGDSNDWLDPDRPTDDELMGTARLRVPGAGRLLEVPAPLRAAAVTGLAALALFGWRRRGRRDRGRRSAGTGGTVASRRRHRTTPVDPPAEGDASMPTDTVKPAPAWSGWPGTLAAVGAALALAGAGLGAVALTTPTTAPGELSYTHQGTFDYTTPAPAGLVYPDGEVATGEPVFLRLVDAVDLVFTHELDAPAGDVHTVGRLWLELADDAGWSHRTPLGDEGEATDEPLVLEAVLDVPGVRELIEEIRAEAGVGGAGGRVDVTAEVDVTATIAGQETTDDFAPTLTFDLGEQRLVPRVDDEGFTITEEGTVTVADADPARLEVAGRGLDVDDARLAAAAALLAGLLAGAIGLAGALGHRRLDEAERLRLRYHSRLLEVDSLRAPANHGLVTVRDMPTLVALAEQAERPILHHEQDGLHTYVVEDETTQYHFRVEVPPPPSAEDESAENPDPVTDPPPTDEDAVPAPGPAPEPGPFPEPEPGPWPEPEPQPDPTRPDPLPDPEPQPQPGPTRPDPTPDPDPMPEPEPRPWPTPEPGPVPEPAPEPQLEAEAWWDEIDDAQAPSDELLFSPASSADRPDPSRKEGDPWVARPPRRSPEPSTPPPGAAAPEDQTAPLEEGGGPERPTPPRARRSKRFRGSGLFRKRDLGEEGPDSSSNGPQDAP